MGESHIHLLPTFGYTVVALSILANLHRERLGIGHINSDIVLLSIFEAIDQNKVQEMCASGSHWQGKEETTISWFVSTNIVVKQPFQLSYDLAFRRFNGFGFTLMVELVKTGMEKLLV